MDKRLFKDGFGWGFLLWLFGYVLGVVLFMIVPPEMIGWVIALIGVVVTWWVLSKKIKSKRLEYYLWLAVIWTVVAIVLDYLLLVQLFKPEDGYYKLDVYLYYLFTFGLPLIVGWRKRSIVKVG